MLAATYNRQVTTALLMTVAQELHGGVAGGATQCLIHKLETGLQQRWHPVLLVGGFGAQAVVFSPDLPNGMISTEVLVTWVPLCFVHFETCFFSLPIEFVRFLRFFS